MYFVLTTYTVSANLTVGRNVKVACDGDSTVRRVLCLSITRVAEGKGNPDFHPIATCFSLSCKPMSFVASQPAPRTRRTEPDLIVLTQSRRFHAMGNDGGSIPKRRELVKNASRVPTVSELKATALESLSHAWAHCALSGEPLDLNAVVSDGHGRLYNYEAILNGLIPGDAPAEATPASMGVTSLRDVVKLKLSKSGDAWACPISMKELGPATRVVYLVPCGHVFAEAAITEIQEKSCPECETAFDPENVIPVLPTTEKDVQRLATRLDGLRAKGLTHTLKKDKLEKKKKRKKEDLPEAKTSEKATGGVSKRARQDGDARVSGINNPLAASLTAKVLAEQDEMNKRRRIAHEMTRG